MAKKASRKKSSGKSISVKSAGQKVAKMRAPEVLIPPSNELERIEKLVPGATNRFITMMETEQQIRKYIVEKTLSNDRLRLFSAVFLGSLLILVIVPLAWVGYPWQAVVLLGFAGTINAILRRFLLRRNKR